MGTASGYGADAVMQRFPVYAHEGPQGEPLPGTVPPAYTYDEQMRAYHDLDRQQQRQRLQQVGAFARVGSSLPEVAQTSDYTDAMRHSPADYGADSSGESL